MDDDVVVKGCSLVTNDPKTFPTLSFSVGSNCVEGISGASDTVAKPFVQCKTYWCWAATVAKMTEGKRLEEIQKKIDGQNFQECHSDNGGMNINAGGKHTGKDGVYWHLDKAQNYIVKTHKKNDSDNASESVSTQMEAIKELTGRTAFVCPHKFLENNEIRNDYVQQFVVAPWKKKSDVILICVRKNYESYPIGQWQGHSYVLEDISGNIFTLFDPMYGSTIQQTREELFRDGFLSTVYEPSYKVIVYDSIYFWDQIEKSTRDQVLKDQEAAKEKEANGVNVG